MPFKVGQQTCETSVFDDPYTVLACFSVWEDKVFYVFREFFLMPESAWILISFLEAFWLHFGGPWALEIWYFGSWILTFFWILFYWTFDQNGFQISVVWATFLASYLRLFRNLVPGRLWDHFWMYFGWTLHGFGSNLACARRFCDGFVAEFW